MTLPRREHDWCDLIGLFALVLSLGGCGVHDVAPYARVAFGSAPEPGAVLALRSSCVETSDDAGETMGAGRPTCDFDRENAVDELVRIAVEFSGHQVVDSERINRAATSADKAWVHGESEQPDTVLSARDLTPALRTALHELGVEGVLSTAVVGGPVRRGRGVQWIEVQVELSRMDTGASVWRSHCRALVYDGERYVRTMARALDAATSCAIEAPRALRRRSAGVEAGE